MHSASLPRPERDPDDHGAMLPVAPDPGRAGAPVRTTSSLGTSFGALAASVGPDRVFLSTFHALAVGTPVVATLSLPDGPALVDGVVVEPGDSAGQGIALALEGHDEAVRARLRAA